jgi:hypothetical protein
MVSRRASCLFTLASLSLLWLVLASCLFDVFRKGEGKGKKHQGVKIQLLNSSRPSCTYYKLQEGGGGVISLSPPGYLRDTAARALSMQCDDSAGSAPAAEMPGVLPLITKWYRDTSGDYRLWPPDSNLSLYDVEEAGWDSCFIDNDTVTPMTRDEVAAYIVKRPPTLAGKPILSSALAEAAACREGPQTVDTSVALLVYFRGDRCLNIKLRDNPPFIGFSSNTPLLLEMKCDPEGSPGQSYSWQIRLLDESDSLLDSAVIQTRIKQ